MAIDTIKDTDKRREVEDIVQKVQPEHQVLISQEILRRQAVLREHLLGFDKAAITKYEIRLLETNYWDIVIQVVQGNLLPPDQIHTSADMAVEDESVKFGESRFTDGQNPIGSCGTFRVDTYMCIALPCGETLAYFSANVCG